MTTRSVGCNSIDGFNGLFLSRLNLFFLDEMPEQAFVRGGRGVGIRNHEAVADGSDSGAQEKTCDQMGCPWENFPIHEQACPWREVLAKQLDRVLRCFALALHFSLSSDIVLILAPTGQVTQADAGGHARRKSK